MNFPCHFNSATPEAICRDSLIRFLVVVIILGVGISPAESHLRAACDSIDATEPVDPESNLEDDLDLLETEEDHEGEVDRLLSLQEHPLDLNTATASLLQGLPGVSYSEAHSVVQLREKLGGFFSLDQLVRADSGGVLLLRKLRPYVFILDAGPASLASKPITVRLRTRQWRDLQPRAGFKDHYFKGSPLSWYGRLLVSQEDRLEAGVLFEKDVGERFSDGFLSAFLAVDGLPLLSRVIVGDFTIDAGQGLVLWRPTQSAKGMIPLEGLKRSESGAHTCTSTDEFSFFRGIAATRRLTSRGYYLSATVFLSARSLSATVNDSGLVSGFYEQGLFRSEAELQKRNAVRESLFGSRILVQSSEAWGIGFSLYRSSFSREVLVDEGVGVRLMSLGVAGVDAHFSLESMTVFGEIARSSPTGLAALVGVAYEPLRGSLFSVTYRHYSPAFNNPHAHAFGNRERTNNETGLCVAMSGRHGRHLGLSAYVDVFKYPWRSTLIPFPVTGHDLLVELESDHWSSANFSVRYRNRSSVISSSGIDNFGRTIKLLSGRRQQTLRFRMRHQLSGRLQLYGSVEKILVGEGNGLEQETGYVLCQGLRYAMLRVLAELRLMFFDTRSFSSRLYQYENDLTGVFHNHLLFGRGDRWYALVRYHLSTNFVLSLKYAETLTDGAKTVGSGPLKIAGDIDNRLSMQVDLTL